MATWTKTSKSEKSETNSRSSTSSASVSRKVLDESMLETILGGLTGQMTREEMTEFAESLLRPQLSANLEASRQQHEAAKLTREQEIEDLAAALSKSIEQQQGAYRQSMADVETAALARGMGRSSYTLSRLAGQGDALAQAVRQLTDENARQTAQIRRQIDLSAQQSAQTQARLNSDYSAQMAAKVQELSQQQRQEYNKNYMTAISAAMGQMTQGTSETTGTSSSSGKTSTMTTSGKTGTSGSSGAKKTEGNDMIDAISGAAPSVKRQTKQ
ncbi:MAG: hypothetical protein IKU73_02015 [Clostridia bacterium]|nr:hypothetical protein [Clostridia bacterium]